MHQRHFEQLPLFFVQGISLSSKSDKFRNKISEKGVISSHRIQQIKGE